MKDVRELVKVKPLEYGFDEKTGVWRATEAGIDYAYWQGADGKWYTDHVHAWASLFGESPPGYLTEADAVASDFKAHESRIYALLEAV